MEYWVTGVLEYWLGISSNTSLLHDSNILRLMQSAANSEEAP